MKAKLGVLPVDSSSLSKRVLVQLRDRIIGGAVQGGTWLKLADLANELGTSITPVRTALAELETQGLVDVAKARGYRVVPPTEADIRDAYLVIGFLSGELSARAAAGADDAFVEQMRKLEGAVVAAYRSASFEDVDLANWEFHRAISHRAGAPRLSRLLRGVTHSVPHDFHGIVSGWTEIALKHHREIVRAIAARDPVRARAIAEQHVAEGCTHLIRHLADVRKAESG
ncbi:MAG TPA: GntR family transcriptional regulator [Candidatus Baltobacteraceae bacterium]|nr:GntR family transcriptional regulator [Candidatus Baltobacteraceae bacterium]